jgi:hypothetical protein
MTRGRIGHAAIAQVERDEPEPCVVIYVPTAGISDTDASVVSNRNVNVSCR